MSNIDEVERYDPIPGRHAAHKGVGCMEQRYNGRYVAFARYEELKAEVERLSGALRSTRLEWACEEVRARVCQEYEREANATRQIAAIDAALAGHEG